MLAARRLERLQALAAEIQNAGGEALAIPVDVNQPAEIEVMVQTALDLYGHIDILFNNAGYGSCGLVREAQPRTRHRNDHQGEPDRHHARHACSPAAHAGKRRKGHIINMSSVAGLIAAPLITTYSAGKYGVRAFTDALRREVAPFGIKVSRHLSGSRRHRVRSKTGTHTITRKSQKTANTLDSHLNMLPAAWWMWRNARAAVSSSRGGSVSSPLSIRFSRRCGLDPLFFSKENHNLD